MGPLTCNYFCILRFAYTACKDAYVHPAHPVKPSSANPTLSFDWRRSDPGSSCPEVLAILLVLGKVFGMQQLTEA